ncbi:Saposin B-type domain-containing protein [Mycena sanguinolenta]|uniref:Saposin B-type domain-containing protein n=1 Tax=Mycena sanguinolenta TaxID=230812 RepID=A0A8H6YIM2_9AGAR|nr:Saposin B-type domain-containing protein [Mycena sanguinolenta]
MCKNMFHLSVRSQIQKRLDDIHLLPVMSAPPTLPPLDSTLGAVEIGAIVGTFLFGIETLQVYLYFDKYTEDTVLLKSLVTATWIFELGHTIATLHAIYALTVTYYAQPQYLESTPRSIPATILFSALIYVVVQSFFANRVRVLSGTRFIPVICWTMTGLRVIASLTLMGIQWADPTITILKGEFRWLMIVAVSLNMAVDTVIMLSMCYCLWMVRHSRFKQTRRMIDTLLVWTVETGVATCFTTGMFLILFLARNDFSWFPFFVVQAKLYSNSFLVSLNGRQRLRESGKMVDISIGPIAQTNSQPSRGLVIEMSKVVEKDTSISNDLHGRDAKV